MKISREKIAELFYIFWIAAFFLFFSVGMFHYSGHSFWGDEMGTVYISSPAHSPLETLKICLTRDVNAPLYYLAANLWLKAVPYGTAWALGLSEICILLGLFVLVKIAHERFGKAAAMAAVSLSCLTPYIVLQGGYEFRCYAMVFLFSALTIRQYFRKIEKQTLSCIFLYGFWGSMMCYTHYAAVLFFFTLFLLDVCLFLRKKITWNHIWAYFFWGIFFFPVMLYSYVNVTNNLVSEYWPVPTIKQFFALEQELLGQPILMGIYLLSGLTLLAALFRKRRFCAGLSADAFLCFAFVFGFKVVNFIYSNLNRSYSLWLTRYFFCVLPAILLLMAWAVSQWVKWLLREPSFLKYGLVSASVAFVLIPLALNWRTELKASRFPELVRQPYEQGAEVIRSQEAFGKADTAYYYSAAQIASWQYYLAHGDMTPGLMALLPLDLSETDLSLYQTIFVMELADPLRTDAWEHLNDKHQCAELHHDYRVWQCIKK